MPKNPILFPPPDPLFLLFLKTSIDVLTLLYHIGEVIHSFSTEISTDFSNMVQFRLREEEAVIRTAFCFILPVW